MKLNWGYKITIFYILFVVGIVYLVVQASRQQVDLVTTDYYSEEVKYQDRIDETKNAQSLSAPIKTTITQGVLTLEFPAELSGKEIKGDVLIYCPSDQKKDLSRNIVTENNLMKISLPEQNKGFHKIKVKFNADGINYYFEKNLTIN